MSKLIQRILFILMSLIGLIGCSGTLQVGVEVTPTPDRSIPATLAVLEEENDRLATRVAAQDAVVPAALNLGQIAYVQGGDIWTLPVLDEAAQPRRLTLDGHNREPRWSTSGQWLAFRKERTTEAANGDTRKQVWLIQIDGTGEHPLNQGQSVESFVWSPTADRLAYTTAAGGLSTINADGTNLLILIPDSLTVPLGEKQAAHIRWSPDGKWIAYEWRIQPASRPLIYQGLWMIAADGGTPIELVNSGIPEKSEALLAGWSTQGDQVLFWQNVTAAQALTEGGQLYTVQAGAALPADAPAQYVSDALILTYADFVAAAPRSPIWEDRETTAYVAGEGQSTWHNKQIKSLGQAITSADLAAISPDWSPDGKRLAFAAMPDQGDPAPQDEQTMLLQRRIWVANAFGDTQPRRLTEAAYRDERPLWSADGNYLLFARLDAKGVTSLWIISADGGLARRIVDELTPAPDPLEASGHIEWPVYFDWWRGP